MQLSTEKSSDGNKNNEVTVQCGANEQVITLGEGEKLTVGGIRQKLSDVLNINEKMLSIVGDENVDDDREILGGQKVQFVKQSGTKG